MSKITTHILDTSLGRPAEGISAVLFFMNENSGWDEIAGRIANRDGRIQDFLKDDIIPEKGIYKIRFDTGKYFSEKNVKGFFPFVEIVFEIESDGHYHIPLLLSNYSYSTYRGS